MLRHKFAAVAGDNPPSVMKGEKKMFSMVLTDSDYCADHLLQFLGTIYPRQEDKSGG